MAGAPRCIVVWATPSRAGAGDVEAQPVSRVAASATNAGVETSRVIRRPSLLGNQVHAAFRTPTGTRGSDFGVHRTDVNDRARPAVIGRAGTKIWSSRRGEERKGRHTFLGRRARRIPGRLDDRHRTW